MGVLNELVVLTGRFSSSKLNDQALVRAKKKDGSCNNGLEVVELTGWSKGGKREGEVGGGRELSCKKDGPASREFRK